MPQDVFISYDTDDQENADDFVAEFRKRGVTSWIATLSIRVAENWKESIDIAIESCNAFLLLISNNSGKSEYVKYELRYAKNQARLKGKIFPVRLENSNSFARLLGSAQRLDYFKVSASRRRRKAFFDSLSTALKETQVSAGPRHPVWDVYDLYRICDMNIRYHGHFLNGMSFQTTMPRSKHRRFIARFRDEVFNALDILIAKITAAREYNDGHIQEYVRLRQAMNKIERDQDLAEPPHRRLLRSCQDETNRALPPRNFYVPPH